MVLTHNWSRGSLVGLIAPNPACAAASLRLIVLTSRTCRRRSGEDTRRCALNDFNPNRPPATQYPPDKLGPRARARNGPTTVRASSMGELMSPSLTFFVWSEPVRAADSMEEHRFLPTSEIRREKRWRFRPHDTAEAVH